MSDEQKKDEVRIAERDGFTVIDKPGPVEINRIHDTTDCECDECKDRQREAGG